MIYAAYEPLGDPKANPGDHFVERGARRLLWRLGIDIEAPDTLFVVGTPWLWHRCAESKKYSDLRVFLEGTRFSRKVAIGIGSCFAWGAPPDLGAGDALEIWDEFDTVICRDELAAGLIDGAVCLPCPSVWTVEKHSGTGSGFLAVDCDPWHPDYLTGSEWIPENYGYLNYKQDEIKDQKELDALLDRLLGYSRIVSRRIHAILPLCPFRKTKVVPSDSRALTATRAGISTDSWSNPSRIMDQREGDWLRGYAEALS